MICPRCNTDNGDRTICKDCGYFMYRATTQNVKKMTRAERSREDAKIIWKKVAKVLRIVWMAIVMIVMSFVMLAALTYFLM